MRTGSSAVSGGYRAAFAASREALTALAIVALCASGAGAGTWVGNGPIGGNGFAVAVDPTDPATVYLGVNGGGIFKSADGGVTWAASSGGIEDPSAWTVQALAIDPSTPSRVYAAVSSGGAGGVFRSTDGGASWSLASLGGYANGLAIDSGTSTTVYASGAAVYRSTDAGVSWSVVLAGDFGSVTADPSTPGTVYAGSLFGSVLRTTDGGSTWTPLSSPAAESVDAIAVDPSSPATLYAGLEDFGVYKSANGGTTWTSVGPAVGAIKLSVQQLVIDPAATGTIYAAGFIAGPTPSVGVFKTTNGGTTWSPTPLVALVRGLAMDPSSPSTLLAATQDGKAVWRTTDGGGSFVVSNDGVANTSVGALAASPAQAGRIWAATAGTGVFRSDDGGGSWSPTAFTSVLETFYSIAADPSSPGTAYVGTHFDGVFKTTDSGATWTQTSTANLPILIGALVVDPVNPAIVYAGGFGGVSKSTTGGGSWAFMGTGLPPAVTTLAIDPTAPATLYAGTDPLMGPFTGVFKSTNGGTSWGAVSAGLPAIAEASVEALAIDPTSPTTLYASIEGAGVFKTTTGGASWSAVNAGLTSLDVQALAVDTMLPDTVYAATGGDGVFVSTSGGASWAASNFGLGNRYVRALAVEGGRVHAGTAGNGVFTSEAAAPAQPVRGKSFVVANPKADDPSRRRVTVVASESLPGVPVDRDVVVANGAALTVSAEGPAGATQTFPLPASGWKKVGATVARYGDSQGVHGLVKSAELSKSAAGVVKIKATIVGRNSTRASVIHVVPPDPGSAGEVVLEVNGGDAYCVGFGGAAGGRVFNRGSALFRVTNPTAAACP